ncbi:hypothetical protein BCR34DRAFT_206984 [Clohesyomyces aquaticus]|uniref:Protein kinase domain-containing protein n=1 Tax=Clohesyomyces aquaticus TaxID=1231657 RepID=A0A1Y2A9F0_9PLEO|nr:hypothetical protein BCR34DRAFT_206984 [Clohesyomyces aquaticus]
MAPADPDSGFYDSSMDPKWEKFLHEFYINCGRRQPSKHEICLLHALIDISEDAIQRHFLQLLINDDSYQTTQALSDNFEHDMVPLDSEIAQDQQYNVSFNSPIVETPVVSIHPGLQASFIEYVHPVINQNELLVENVCLNQNTTLSQSSLEPELPIPRPDPNQSTQLSPIQLSPSLLSLVEATISHAKSRKCKKIRAHETQSGAYQCTLGCGRKFKNPSEWRRHEELIHLQTFWFCPECGDLDNPSTRHLFTRKDKFQKHVQKQHPDWIKSAALTYSRVHYTAPFPDHCGFCDRNRFHARDWAHRCNHIAKMHFKKGETMGSWRDWSSGVDDDDGDVEDDESGDIKSDSDSDDDDDDDDENEGGDDTNGNESSDTTPDEDSDSEPHMQSGPPFFRPSARDDDVFEDLDNDFGGLFGMPAWNLFRTITERRRPGLVSTLFKTTLEPNNRQARISDPHPFNAYSAPNPRGYIRTKRSTFHKLPAAWDSQSTVRTSSGQSLHSARSLSPYAEDVNRLNHEHKESGLHAGLAKTWSVFDHLGSTSNVGLAAATPRTGQLKIAVLDQGFYADEIFASSPFHKAKINSKGGTASVFKVTARSEGIQSPQIFVLKTYHDRYRALYDAEREAFFALRGHTNIIRYLGSFTKTSIIGGVTHNIVLEHADCDLSEYFETHGPPKDQGEVMHFWSELFEIVSAVQKIHNPRRRTQGWHADIKPDNILYVHGKFKLADFGFSKFVEIGDGEAAKHIMTGGTLTYSAPECFIPETKTRPVSQAIDIWSLGCVYSEAVVWSILGSNGLLEYKQLRLRNLRENWTLGEAKPDLWTHPLFHDGNKTLSAVFDTHAHVRLRASDLGDFIKPLLRLIEDLLHSEPERRPTAIQISERSRNLLHIADRYQEVTSPVCKFRPPGSNANDFLLKETENWKRCEWTWVRLMDRFEPEIIAPLFSGTRKDKKYERQARAFTGQGLGGCGQGTSKYNLHAVQEAILRLEQLQRGQLNDANSKDRPDQTPSSTTSHSGVFPNKTVAANRPSLSRVLHCISKNPGKRRQEALGTKTSICSDRYSHFQNSFGTSKDRPLLHYSSPTTSVSKATTKATQSFGISALDTRDFVERNVGTRPLLRQPNVQRSWECRHPSCNGWKSWDGFPHLQYSHCQSMSDYTGTTCYMAGFKTPYLRRPEQHVVDQHHMPRAQEKDFTCRYPNARFLNEFLISDIENWKRRIPGHNAQSYSSLGSFTQYLDLRRSNERAEDVSELDTLLSRDFERHQHIFLRASSLLVSCLFLSRQLSTVTISLAAAIITLVLMGILMWSVSITWMELLLPHPLPSSPEILAALVVWAIQVTLAYVCFIVGLGLTCLVNLIPISLYGKIERAWSIAKIVMVFMLLAAMLPITVSDSKRSISRPGRNRCSCDVGAQCGEMDIAPDSRVGLFMFWTWILASVYAETLRCSYPLTLALDRFEQSPHRLGSELIPRILLDAPLIRASLSGSRIILHLLSRFGTAIFGVSSSIACGTSGVSPPSVVPFATGFMAFYYNVLVVYFSSFGHEIVQISAHETGSPRHQPPEISTLCVQHTLSGTPGISDDSTDPRLLALAFRLTLCQNPGRISESDELDRGYHTLDAPRCLLQNFGLFPFMYSIASAVLLIGHQNRRKSSEMAVHLIHLPRGVGCRPARISDLRLISQLPLSDSWNGIPGYTVKYVSYAVSTRCWLRSGSGLGVISASVPTAVPTMIIIEFIDEIGTPRHSPIGSLPPSMINWPVLCNK